MTTIYVCDFSFQANHIKELSDQQAASTGVEREKRKAKSKKAKGKPSDDQT